VNSVKKSAYIAWNSEIDEFLRILKNESNARMFYKGQDLLHQMPRYWFVSDVPKNQPLYRLTQIMASGIYEHLKYWLQDIGRIGFRKNAGERLAPLSTNHNVFFIFYVLFIGNVISIFCFACETLKILKRVLTQYSFI